MNAEPYTPLFGRSAPLSVLERCHLSVVVAGSAAAMTMFLAKWAYWSSGHPSLAGNDVGFGLTFVVLCAGGSFGLSIWLAARRDVLASLVLALPGYASTASAGSLSVQLMVFHTGRDLPMVDGRLAAVDTALGFDWPAMFAWIAATPLARDLLSGAYASIYVQPLLLLILFICRRDALSFCRLQVALQLSFLVGCLVASAFPAITAYGHHGMTADLHPGFTPAFANGPTPIIALLRSADLPAALPPFPDLRIISFPSWHAAAGILFAWSTWSMPLVRYPSLALNAGMVLATPVIGGHYLVDVLAGMALGAASFLAADALVGFGSRFRAARSPLYRAPTSNATTPMPTSPMPANSRLDGA